VYSLLLKSFPEGRLYICVCVGGGGVWWLGFLEGGRAVLLLYSQVTTIISWAYACVFVCVTCNMYLDLNTSSEATHMLPSA
jgi:hypothetical protein